MTAATQPGRRDLDAPIHARLAELEMQLAKLEASRDTVTTLPDYEALEHEIRRVEDEHYGLWFRLYPSERSRCEPEPTLNGDALGWAADLLYGQRGRA